MAESDCGGFWNETMNQLRAELGEEEFGGWFTGVQYLRSGENRVVIGFPSSFLRDSIKTRYLDSIKTKLTRLAGREIALEFEVLPANRAENPGLPEKSGAEYAAESPIPEEKREPAAGSIPAGKPKKKQHPQMRDDYTFEKYIIGENNN